jgi:putative transposase
VLRDDYLLGQIRRVHQDHFGVYGPRKVWVQLHREGITVARCTVERLMRVAGLEGARRRRTTPTTTRSRGEATADDLLERDFGAAAPNQTWVADLTYVETTSGFCYTALVVDCYARLIVGWAVASHLRAELALDALEMALWRRGGQALDGLVHHSDKGAQYTALRYTDRLEAAGIAPSVGSTGDSYDNALAESVIGLYKTELIEPVKPWSTTADVELATLEYIDWFNNRRILEPLGDRPPAEAEAIHAAATHQPDHTDGTQ